MTTKIEWTDETWNPIRGCSRVSEGCRNCYAERVAQRFSGPGQPYEGLIAKGGQWNGQIKLVPDKLTEPLRWKKPRRVFVNSMSDLFHENVPSSTIQAVFTIMGSAQNHTFQVLTKRPHRMRHLLHEWKESGLLLREGHGAVLPNVWLGVSIEDQQTADERIPLLLETPAAVRWVSAEPLLGPVDVYGGDPDPRLGGIKAGQGLSLEQYWKADGSGPFPGVDWVVAGGESGPGARPMHPDWARSLRDQCNAAAVPFFFKQWGEWRPSISGMALAPNGTSPGPEAWVDPSTAWMRRVGKKSAGRILDGREWNEYPDLQEGSHGPL